MPPVIAPDNSSGWVRLRQPETDLFRWKMAFESVAARRALRHRTVLDHVEDNINGYLMGSAVCGLGGVRRAFSYILFAGAPPPHTLKYSHTRSHALRPASMSE
jgi:hypothetical protein